MTDNQLVTQVTPEMQRAYVEWAAPDLPPTAHPAKLLGFARAAFYAGWQARLTHSPASDVGDLLFQLGVAATTFETVQSKEYREGIFNASHAKLLRKAVAALRSQRASGDANTGGADAALEALRALPPAGVTEEMARDLFHIARTAFLYMAHKELGHVGGGELFHTLEWPEDAPKFVDGRLEEIRVVLAKYEAERLSLIAAMGV